MLKRFRILAKRCSVPRRSNLELWLVVGGREAWLHADMQTSCTASPYLHLLRNTAIVMVVIYPVGIPCVIAARCARPLAPPVVLAGLRLYAGAPRLLGSGRRANCGACAPRVRYGRTTRFVSGMR